MLVSWGIQSAGVRRNSCWTPPPFFGEGVGPTTRTTKEPRTPSSQMATFNAKRMLHREPHPQSMEAIENHCNTETRKGLSNTDIPPMSHYKLYEHLILNRIAPSIDQHLIKKQPGFRPARSCCSQLLNPDKTQVTSFHLKNREAKRTLKVNWNNTDLENTPIRSTYVSLWTEP